MGRSCSLPAPTGTISSPKTCDHQQHNSLSNEASNTHTSHSRVPTERLMFDNVVPTQHQSDDGGGAGQDHDENKEETVANGADIEASCWNSGCSSRTCGHRDSLSLHQPDHRCSGCREHRSVHLLVYSAQGLLSISRCLLCCCCCFPSLLLLTIAIVITDNHNSFALFSNVIQRRHWLNTWVGTVNGCLPPVMGYTAINASLTDNSTLAMFLFVSLYAWQIPHFMAISYKCGHDYEKAGFKMLSNKDPKHAAWAAVTHSLLMMVLCAVVAKKRDAPWFLVTSLPINFSMQLYPSIRFLLDRNYDTATVLFWGSLFHLPSLFLPIVGRGLVRSSQFLSHHQ